MRIESAKRVRSTVRRTLVAVACSLVLPAARAQTPEQQVVNDAATALGGRDRVMAVKTMLLEGAGNFVGITSLRYDDDIGFKSAIEQLRDCEARLRSGERPGQVRAHPHGRVRVLHRQTRRRERFRGSTGRSRSTSTRANQNATPAFGNQASGRRLEYLRHPLTLVRAALGPDAKLSNSRTQGTERMVDIAIDDLPTLTLAINATTKLPTRIFQMVDNNIIGDTLQAIEFTDYKTVNGLQLPTLFTNWQDKREIGQIRIHRTTIDGDVGNLAAPASLATAAGRRRRTWRRTRRLTPPGTRRRNSPRACGSSPARRITA